MTIRSAALRLVATGGGVLAVVGCIGVPGSAHAREPQTITIEVSDSDFQNQWFVTREATVSVGDTLTVILASNGSNGFGWTADARIGDTTVMQQTSHGTAGPTTTLLGAPGTEEWTFAALSTGTTTIATDYGRPWEGGEKGVWTFSATVTVQ